MASWNPERRRPAALPDPEAHMAALLVIANLGIWLNNLDVLIRAFTG